MTNNKERVVYQTMVALSKKDTDIAYKYQKKIYLESMRKILLKQVSKGLLLQRNAIKQGRWVILHTARYKVIYKNIYFYIKNREGGCPIGITHLPLPILAIVTVKQKVQSY